jgi:hypothetical protein
MRRACPAALIAPSLGGAGSGLLQGVTPLMIRGGQPPAGLAGWPA